MDNIPEAVSAVLDGPIESEEKLPGGMISLTRRLRMKSGQSVVLKQCVTAPVGLYTAEAEGLKTLSVDGGPRVPEVLSVGHDHLLLEDLGKSEPGDGYWEKFGRQVATLHSHGNDKFGFHHVNYLGLLPMDNTWSEDGHEFFARTRILRFLEEPHTQAVTTSDDRLAVERIASRLPSLIPLQGPSLIHGDLWSGNMACGSDGRPAFIDPAAYYGWPEAELAMTAQYSGVEPAFFDAYREVHPLEPGWEDRLVLLQIRELLSMIAHTADEYGTVAKLREVLKRFA